MEPTRACPVCAQPMQSESRDNVTVDFCDDHGIWLDKGELETLLDRRDGAWEDRVKAVSDKAFRDRWKWLFWGAFWS